MKYDTVFILKSVSTGLVRQVESNFMVNCMHERFRRFFVFGEFFRAAATFFGTFIAVFIRVSASSSSRFHCCSLFRLRRPFLSALMAVKTNRTARFFFDICFPIALTSFKSRSSTKYIYAFFPTSFAIFV